MNNQAHTAALLSVPLDDRAATPLFRQLYEGRSGHPGRPTQRLGVRLPATRVLASELNVSRNTILNAFEQLLAEGYLVGRLGSGTYVAPTLPEELLQTHARPRPPPPPAGPAAGEARQSAGQGTAPGHRAQGPPRPFRPGLPAPR